MRHPWVNILLLILLTAELVTGYGGLTSGSAGRGWWTWVHGAGGFTILGLLVWKASVVLNVYRRGLEWNVHRAAFFVQILILLATLASGLIWTFDGPVRYLGYSLLTLHILLAVGSGGLLLWHAWYMRFILRHPAARDRRTFLRLGVSVLSGLALMVLWDQVKGVLRVAGAARRFTGSYETGSFDGSFPVVAWIADRQPAVEAASWLLAIRGAVKAPLDLSLPELKSLPQVEVVATLDCTGGWYTTQVWEGVPLGVLLQRAGLSAEARSVTVRSITGYQRRYPIEEAKGFLLALGVAHNPLGRGHGFPVRLVAPGRRGFDWVKWVQEVQINETDAAWQSPLPLQ